MQHDNSYRMDLPEPLFHSHTHLLRAMEDTAAVLGESPTEARNLFLVLPEELRGATAAVSKFDNSWHYAFGEVFTGLPNQTVILSSAQCPPVERLYRSVKAVQRHFNEEVQQELLRKLGHERKHRHFLDELLLLLWIPEGTTVEKDVRLQPSFNLRDVDFVFSHPKWPQFALEVKRREKDVIDHAAAFIVNESVGEPTKEIAPPIPDILFRSVVEKFPACNSASRLQGVWIFPHIKQNEADLWEHFQSIDSEKVHFAVLSDDNRSGYVLYRSPEIERIVCGFFGIAQSKQHVM